MSRPRPSFGDVVDAHQRPVLRYLRRLTGSAAEAEDLFQETFLRALTAFDRLGSDGHHAAWVFRIATNVFLNHRRAQRRRPEVPLVEDLTSLHPAHHPDQRAATWSYRRAIAALPARQRAAFVQRRLLGRDYREIARAMGGTEAGARANVYQAARRLRQVVGLPARGGRRHGNDRDELRADERSARRRAGR